MTADALGFLGLMRRAGKLQAGEEGVRRAVHAGKAKLVLLASDASENAQKRGEGFARQAGVPLLRLDADKAELSLALGVQGGAMFAVCDAGFAGALRKKLAPEQN